MCKELPNILVFMTDQMQKNPLDTDHICKTPNFDQLIQRGTVFQRAYTPNAVCSPARASLMTGMLPHNHGVLWVTHTMDKDQGMLRTDYPHFSQRLKELDYTNGYFGKWHVERSEKLMNFGWDVDCGLEGEKMQEIRKNLPKASENLVMSHYLNQEGYSDILFSGVTSVAPEERLLGKVPDMAIDFIENQNENPWCCFVSLTEPHDPFVCGEDAYREYEGKEMPLPENFKDSMLDKPDIYRRSAEVFQDISQKQWQEAIRCYYASITEIDAQFGKIIERLRKIDQLDNTIIIVTTDHGDMLGSHGMYCKNIGAFEEIYNIPLIFAGPGISQGSSDVRVGLHDIYPTLMEYLDINKVSTDGQSFLPVLQDPVKAGVWNQEGFAEYFGGRMFFNQRIYYNGQFKYIFNGFAYDELYDLENDPGEMHNLAQNPKYQEILADMTSGFWKWVKKTGDKTLLNSSYPPFRFASPGPEILNKEG